MNQTLAMFNQAGAEKFSQLACQMAPYFSSIAPRFVTLEPGYAEVRFEKTRAVENHLGTVHAIAMCNAAELAAGTMTQASLPDGMRWIPKNMQVSYLAKAKTGLRAVANGRDIDFSQAGDKDITVNLLDDSDKEECRIVITMDVRAA